MTDQKIIGLLSIALVLAGGYLAYQIIDAFIIIFKTI